MEYQTLVQTIALSAGVAWASGINLYAVVAILGLGGSFGYITLPPTLAIVQDPLVITAATFMFVVQFFMDKIPGVDSGWDALHTFVRIPAGALLAAGAVGNVDPALVVTAGLLRHHYRNPHDHAGTRALINTSPEPFSNWTASILEDVAVFGGLWRRFHAPHGILAAVPRVCPLSRRFCSLPVSRYSCRRLSHWRLVSHMPGAAGEAPAHGAPGGGPLPNTAH
ncbi:MAG: DUF4126 domain-containing protein [Pseudomonadales bacterium]